MRVRGPRSGLLSTARLLLDPASFFAESFARFGDPFVAPIRGEPVFFTSHPEGIQQIFRAPTDTLTPYDPENLGALLGRHSLLLMEGEPHRRERALLMPSFHGERMRAYAETMREVTLRRLRRVERGRVFPALDLTQSISLEVIIRVIFGVEGDEVEGTFALTKRFVDAINPFTVFFDNITKHLPAWGPLGASRRAADELDALLAAEVERRRGSGQRGDDVLSLLLDARTEDGEALSTRDLCDELRTLLFAGHETTSISLAWALHFLHRDDGVRDRLLEELRARARAGVDELVRSPWLNAVCDEALRLHPVVPFIAKTASRPFTLRGVDVPAGAGVFAATAHAHLDPGVFPEAQAFRPQRFLENKPGPFAYFPFGGGARRCLGAAFAHYEMRVVLSTLLLHHRFEGVGGELRSVARGPTRAPSRGAPLRSLGAA